MKRIPSVALGRHLLVIAGLMLASTVGNLSAADTYYVSDHLATTTAVADAAGEIASLEADAFGSPVSGGEQASRYTGKPYDADIGAYVFPFRNYRSEEARWMSADPSGFPDGVNQLKYINNPFIMMDALGLAASDAWALTGDFTGISAVYWIPKGFNNTDITVSFGITVKAVYDASPAVTSAYQFFLKGTVGVTGVGEDSSKTSELNINTGTVSGASVEVAPTWSKKLGVGSYTATLLGELYNGNLNPNDMNLPKSYSFEVKKRTE